MCVLCVLRKMVFVPKLWMNEILKNKLLVLKDSTKKKVNGLSGTSLLKLYTIESQVNLLPLLPITAYNLLIRLSY